MTECRCWTQGKLVLHLEFSFRFWCLHSWLWIVWVGDRIKLYNFPSKLVGHGVSIWIKAIKGEIDYLNWLSSYCCLLAFDFEVSRHQSKSRHLSAQEFVYKQKTTHLLSAALCNERISTCFLRPLSLCGLWALWLRDPQMYPHSQCLYCWYGNIWFQLALANQSSLFVTRLSPQPSYQFSCITPTWCQVFLSPRSLLVKPVFCSLAVYHYLDRHQ